MTCTILELQCHSAHQSEHQSWKCKIRCRSKVHYNNRRKCSQGYKQSWCCPMKMPHITYGERASIIQWLQKLVKDIIMGNCISILPKVGWCHEFITWRDQCHSQQIAILGLLGLGNSYLPLLPVTRIGVPSKTGLPETLPVFFEIPSFPKPLIG